MTQLSSNAELLLGAFVTRGTKFLPEQSLLGYRGLYGTEFGAALMELLDSGLVEQLPMGRYHLTVEGWDFLGSPAAVV